MDLFCKIERVEPTPEKIKESENIFYIDKYKPKKKEDFLIHSSLIDKIDNFTKCGISNINFYGTNDVGKYTLARYMIENYYNNPCHLKKTVFSFEGKEIIYFRSYYHCELYIDDYNCNVINLVKKFFQHVIVPLNSSTFDSLKNIILIKNIDILKTEIINLIKYYLDKHYNNVFVLVSSTPNKCLKSFFANIRIPSPTTEEMTKLVKKIIKKESLKVKKKELNYIIEKGNRQIFKTVCLLENCYQDGEFEENFDSNEKMVYFIYKLIKRPNIDGMIKIRNYLNTLLVNNISIKTILKWLLDRIVRDKKINNNDKSVCISYIVESELNFRKGYREIHHLEYSIIRIINLLKNKWE